MDVSLAMGHIVVPKAEQRRIFESGSPTTEIYKRRQLAPIYRVGEVIEREWWPRIQPHCEVFLGQTGPRMTADGPGVLKPTDAGSDTYRQ
nr:hypothetical protein DWF04_16470 [Cereibacter sphaeroides f. sp. denitrificans]